ncbi:MAG: hypothetical protein ACM3VV_00115 [Deltaproteobacteria bacterium]
MLKVDNNNSNFSYKIYSKWFVACIVVGFAILHSLHTITSSIISNNSSNECNTKWRQNKNNYD